MGGLQMRNHIADTTSFDAAQSWSKAVLAALIAIASGMGPIALASGQKTYVIDPENPGAPVFIKPDSMRSNPRGLTLKTPTMIVGRDDLEPARATPKVKREVVTRYVPQRLRFNRLSVSGAPAQPRVKFSRDAELFMGARIRDEGVRADFYGKVADDLNP